MIDILVGSQWGDEGKGKVIDAISGFYTAIIRASGGANAGHTIFVDGVKTVLHLIPSGVLRPWIVCVLSPGMVIDPFVLWSEIQSLGVDNTKLFVADTASLVLPKHILEDRERNGHIGTTNKGIGPAYEDKISRRGLKLKDLCDTEKLQAVVASQENIDKLLEVAQNLEPFLCDYQQLLGEMKDHKILIEGAQGTLLDIDFGTYPFVTSSNTTSAGACAATGIAPTQIKNVIGVSKCYTTRVGSGPFPTQMDEHSENIIRAVGKEYGATTGRPRKCGWLDLPALRYACRLNGITHLFLNKLDVLASLDFIYVCDRYEVNGELTFDFPINQLDIAKPIYEKLSSWNKCANVQSYAELPLEAQMYIEYIEIEMAKEGVQLFAIGTGESREDMIHLLHSF